MDFLTISIIWFGLLYFITLHYYRKYELFHPVKILCILHILGNLLYLIALKFDSEIFPHYILSFLGMELDEALPKFTIIKTIEFISLLIGISVAGKAVMRFKYRFLMLNKNVLNISSYILLAIGSLAYVLFLNQEGGLNALLNSLSNRVELQSGAYSLMLLSLLTLATIFRFKIYGLVKSNMNKIIAIAFILYSIIVRSTLGGRRSSIFLILVSMAAYHYYVKNIKISTLKKSRIAICILLISIYTLFIPILRAPNGFQRVSEGEIALTELVNVSELISYFSYSYIEIFIVHYFDSTKTWDFKTFLTIPYNLNFYQPNHLQPPVDEGVYLYNTVRYNRHFSPQTPRYKLHITSLPIENFGFGYANGLLIGLILSSVLLGMMYKLAYNYFIANGLNPVILFGYLFIVFTFNFSSLRLVNLMQVLINIIIALIVLRFSRYFKFNT